MMKVLVIAEHNNHTLNLATHHTMTAAQSLGEEIDLGVIGHQCKKVAEDASKFTYAKRILVADHPVYEHQLAENVAPLIADLGTHYDYILMPATTFGKNILPRTAALLDVSMISDVIRILSADTFVRPLYAGNAIAEVQSQDKIKLLTARTTAFDAMENILGNAEIVSIPTVIPNDL
jgi:electron transfer flavoprotein alpha subunit